MDGIQIVIERAGVALGRRVGRERAEASTVEVDDPFEPDPDPRELPLPVHSMGLTVLSDGAVAGAVNWLPVLHGPSYPCLAWMIGVLVLPAHRGNGLGTASQRLLAEHLFASTDIDRVEAETDAENVAERRALLRAGFTEEGVARGAQLRGGIRRDLVRFGLLRSDLL